MIKAFEKHGLIIQGWVAIERNPTIEGQRVELRLTPNPTLYYQPVFFKSFNSCIKPLETHLSNPQVRETGCRTQPWIKSVT